MYFRLPCLVQLILFFCGLVELSLIDAAPSLEAHLAKRGFFWWKWKCALWCPSKFDDISSKTSTNPIQSQQTDVLPAPAYILSPSPIPSPSLAPEPKIIYVEQPASQTALPPQIIYVQEPEPQSADNATEVNEISPPLATSNSGSVYMPKQCTGENCAG